MNSLFREIDNLKLIRAKFGLLMAGQPADALCYAVLQQVLDENSNKGYDLFVQAVTVGEFNASKVLECLEREISRLEGLTVGYTKIPLARFSRDAE